MQMSIPAPIGTRAFHFLIISLDIFRFAPLSGLKFPFSCRGCWHFLLDLQYFPNSARCLGHIVISDPASPKIPTRARISSFSSLIHDCETWILRRWALISCVHLSIGRKCLRPGNLDEISHSLLQNDWNEHDKDDILFYNDVLYTIHCLDTISSTTKSSKKYFEIL